MSNINYYRLGDLVYHNYLTKEEEDKILQYHPNTLGSKYIIEKIRNNKDDINDTDYRLLIFIKIVFEYLITIIDKIPKDIIKSLLEKNKAKLIVVKVPTNYNFDLLKNIGYKYNRQPIYKKANRVVYEIIYIFNY